MDQIYFVRGSGLYFRDGNKAHRIATLPVEECEKLSEYLQKFVNMLQTAKATEERLANYEKVFHREDDEA